MNQIRFYLSLSSEKYLRYYQGSARAVSVTSVDGRRLAFPAEHLRPFVTREGVHGEFIISFDEARRFKELKRIGDLPAGRG